MSVAENHRLPAGKDGGDEQRNHGRVGAAGILSWPEDVEIADRDRFQPVGGSAGLAVVFGGQFGGPIGRNRCRQVGLAFGTVGLIAVCTGRAGIDHASHAGPASSVQKRQRAGYAGGVGCQGFFDASGYRGQCRLVEDAVDPLNKLGDQIGVDQVSFEEFD